MYSEGLDTAIEIAAGRSKQEIYPVSFIIQKWNLGSKTYMRWLDKVVRVGSLKHDMQENYKISTKQVEKLKNLTKGSSPNGTGGLASKNKKAA